MNSRNFRFAIDRGGTFTDVYAEFPSDNGGVTCRVLKLLSEDPDNYRDAPREGIRRILQEETGISHPKQDPLDTSRILEIRMGTTVATNALLERKGERCALVITRGFKDLLYIGNQTRPNIFDVKIKKPDMLYEMVVEVDERVILMREDCESNVVRVVQGTTGEMVGVELDPDVEKIRHDLLQVHNAGVRSIAVALMHSYTFPHHEILIGQIAQKIGFSQISLSSAIMPMVKFVPRGYTTCLDAYLTPVIKRYLSNFCSEFDSNLIANVKILFMQSDGGLTPLDLFSGHRAILSGPAGGVVGYSSTTPTNLHHLLHNSSPQDLQLNTLPQQLIAFDMGGTSTDVSRFSQNLSHTFESQISGIIISSPQLDINTIASGGGSRLFYKNRMFIVGPESVGAHPGPVCYRKKGSGICVTDANAVLGRLVPEYFPAIFGPSGNEMIDVDGSREAMQELADVINSDSIHDAQLTGKDAKLMSLDEVALGFIRMACECMSRPIKNLTSSKGHNLAQHILVCFGGAGPQVLCSLARILRIKVCYLHRWGGILSAYGLHLADLVVEKQTAVMNVIRSTKDVNNSKNFEFVDISENETEMTNWRELILNQIQSLNQSAINELVTKGDVDINDPKAVTSIWYFNMRYAGTDCSLMISTFKTSDANPSNSIHRCDYIHQFCAEYKHEFGFLLPNRDIVIEDIRVRVIGHSRVSNPTSQVSQAVIDILNAKSDPQVDIVTNLTPDTHKSVRFEENRIMAPIYSLKTIMKECFSSPNASRRIIKLTGPCLIIQEISTLVVEEGFDVIIDKDQNIVLIDTHDDNRSHIEEEKGTVSAPKVLPVDILTQSIFSHRFMSIAEQMGRTLQRTSVSVNIKERLDFSCALFDGSGGLVANAPHLPVHLGSMSDAVKYQIQYYSNCGSSEMALKPGDVLLSNHPQLAGGSHLPDLTVITPMWIEKRDSNGHSVPEIAFYLASRGHHADIGGITPGSMPPHSTLLSQEGVAIISFKLVNSDLFDEEGTRVVFAQSRNVEDNINDLRAQVAANKRGIELLNSLVKDEYSLETVISYMKYIQINAKESVQNMLTEFSLSRQMSEVDSVSAVDYLDDGSPINLNITINRQSKTAIFDFTGTGPQVLGNTNAPPSVVKSAIIYALKCMLRNIDIPLNQGCLEPITIIIPPCSLLNPSPTAAVVGGNVLTSQRITDVIFSAFQFCANSQGCMNNFTFGEGGWGYYETIGGGAGACRDFQGASGVQVHMTNTRITDVEIMERRYPVIVKRFGLRHGSGGDGVFSGGEGVIRMILFRRGMIMSILSERRCLKPNGMCGGGNGKSGVNLLKRLDGVYINLGGKSSVSVLPNEIAIIMTPGGGGYGGRNGIQGSCQRQLGWVEEIDLNRNVSVHTIKSKSSALEVEEKETLVGVGSLGEYSRAQEGV